VRLPHRGVKPGSVKLAVRPDAIVLNETASSAASIRGMVTKASYLGTQMEYEVETPVGNLFVVQYGSRDPLPMGTDVAVSLTPERGVAIIPNA
jgi:iron(III) transport system ATP-binding protein